MPISPSATAMTAAPAICRRRVRSRTANVEGLTNPLSSVEWSSDEVDDGEQADPDDVDEVPVVGHDDRRCRLGGRERPERAPDEQEHEGDQPAEHVQAVKAGRYVVDGPVAVGGQREVVVHEVLERLAADEHGAHEERDDEPEPQPAGVAALGSEDAELAGDAGE